MRKIFMWNVKYFLLFTLNIYTILYIIYTVKICTISYDCKDVHYTIYNMYCRDIHYTMYHTVKIYTILYIICTVKIYTILCKITVRLEMFNLWPFFQVCVILGGGEGGEGIGRLICWKYLSSGSHRTPIKPNTS